MDISEIRRSNLRTLLGRFASTAEFERLHPTFSAGYLRQITSGERNLGARVARRLEAEFGMAKGWMDAAHHNDVGYGARESGSGNVTSAPDQDVRVPLLAWDRLTAMRDVTDLARSGAHLEYVHVSRFGREKLGAGCFALRVEGDSMVSRTAPSFPEGCIIVVDPDRPLVSGAFVVVQINNHARAAFRRYVDDGAQATLIALNDAYRPLVVASDMMYLGRVVRIAEISLD